jgi:hypothetical protein
LSSEPKHKRNGKIEERSSRRRWDGVNTCGQKRRRCNAPKHHMQEYTAVAT